MLEDEITTIGTSPLTAAEDLDALASRWWQIGRSKDRLRNAAAWLRQQGRTITDLHKRLAQQERAFQNTTEGWTREAEKSAKDLMKRAKIAIDEMASYKKSRCFEEPVAIVVSPFQYAEMTLHGAFKRSKMFGLPVYVARGVYGPVILTQPAFDAFTRNAPEMDIRSKVPTNGHDW